MRRNLLYVSSIGEDCCAAAQDFHVGIELAQFCTAARLDGAPAEPWEIPVERCLSAADRFILHGPFNELTPAAIDPLVLDVTKKRYRQAIAQARTLGIQKVVLHAGFQPLVYYPEWFIDRSAAVWQELLCEIPDDMTVCLETCSSRSRVCSRQSWEPSATRACVSASISATPIPARRTFPRKTGCAPARRICLMCICTTIRAAMICMRRFLTA